MTCTLRVSRSTIGASCLRERITLVHLKPNVNAQPAPSVLATGANPAPQASTNMDVPIPEPTGQTIVLSAPPPKPPLLPLVAFGSSLAKKYYEKFEAPASPTEDPPNWTTQFIKEYQPL
ncbi:hypothetical protein Ae201684P_001391 [Aphanomyces euteiches]|uniref:Uncharacterized protein n=1 Tax=Aphanomyces euteiches TaxID=100861 RepID=A0A6G0WTB9_9STRA|nr:hypothetical protein Ae201684_011848 [Aphanomyces euteiches]KAH9089185.1 hypothetical protein Ae201684P_001391 [Aphanomyces euteiches]